jgi:hypothetical protein
LDKESVKQVADGPPRESCAKQLRYIQGESAPIARMTMEQAG